MPASAPTRPAIRVETHETLGSTNEEALARARAGDRGPLWIVARRQSAGRGRRGRTWHSEAGNLFASLLIADPAPADRTPEMPFVAALAVHDAIVACAAALGPRLSLKWPNDILLDGAKIGGILVEGESAGGRPLAVVIGIGVNCATHPEDTLYPAGDLAGGGAIVTPDRLFAELMPAMAHRLARWSRGAGFASIRADWLKRAAGLGEELKVAFAGGEAVGRFETLDPTGRLILVRRNGTREIVTAGDIFPAAASSDAAGSAG